MFNRKLKKQIEILSASNARLRTVNRSLIEECGSLRLAIEELERTNQPSFDMNILFAAVLDYRRCLKMVGAPDPVEGRREIRKVFEKYRVKF